MQDVMLIYQGDALARQKRQSASQHRDLPIP